MSVLGNFFPSMLRRRHLSSFRPRNIIWNFSGFAIIPLLKTSLKVVLGRAEERGG